ncbi:hypothetical protein ACTPEM_24180, partial [Clostridioides difficile]
EKTGIKLIKEFSSIENLIENTDKLKGSVKKKIEENKEIAIQRYATTAATITLVLSLDFE